MQETLGYDTVENHSVGFLMFVILPTLHMRDMAYRHAISLICHVRRGMTYRRNSSITDTFFQISRVNLGKTQLQREANKIWRNWASW